MIQPDAKCINNGKKLNETIKGLNSILDNVVSEEIDIVDSRNQPNKRWFVIGRLKGQKQDSDTGDRDNLGNTPNDKNRDKLDTGGAPLDAGGAGVAPNSSVTGGAGALKDDGTRPANQGGGIAGGALLDDGQTAEQSRANFLANKQRAAGNAPAPSGIAGGALLDDGQTAEQSRANFLANKQRAAGTNQPGGALLDDGSRPVNQTGQQPNQQQDPATRDDARKQQRADGVDPREAEKGRRKLEAFRKKQRQNSTGTFLQDLAAKKRQVQADKMAAANRAGAKYSPYSRR